jgi:NAD(P)-dependent dehydrogenase (short-subunit alcohol dehydrogenase family)
MEGKVAVVTGGASGIGRAIAARLADSGAHVRIIDLTRDDRVTREIGNSADVQLQQCDISDKAQVQNVFSQISRAERISILVNCAGIAHVGNLESTTEMDFEKIYRVNVRGTYNCMQACIGNMKANGGGVILNMASVAASSGLADRFAYSMSKGAVVSMSYSVAKDYLPYKIRCNCISPARVHTPFVDGFLAKNYPGREKEVFEELSRKQPVGRMGDPDEIAALALFLCSDEASFITGVDYPIDGGFLNLRD